MPDPDGTCPICGGNLGTRHPYPGAARHDSPFPLHAIAVCDSCGAGIMIPRPAQETLDRFYASGAYWHAASGETQRVHEFSQGRIRVQRILALLPRGRHIAVADIGAGHGGIAAALADLGVPVARYQYVEPDSVACAAIGAMELPFPSLRRDAVSALDGGQDLLLLNHVLEHVTEPFEFLGAALRCLAPGALVHVETPHADYRFKDDVFPHVFFFSPDAMRRLGERLGVETLACETFGRWLAPRFTPRGLAQRVAARGLAMSARLGWPWAQRAMDRAIWGYAPEPNGIWLRWIFRSP